MVNNKLLRLYSLNTHVKNVLKGICCESSVHSVAPFQAMHFHEILVNGHTPQIDKLRKFFFNKD